MSREKSKCGNCKYYKCAPQPGRDPEAFGKCHKHAPRWSPQFAVATSKETQLKYLDNGWPLVSQKLFCGEFKSNE